MGVISHQLSVISTDERPAQKEGNLLGGAFI
jgi:hypothetical protein